MLQYYKGSARVADWDREIRNLKGRFDIGGLDIDGTDTRSTPTI